jgi:ribosome recycling factor
MSDELSNISAHALDSMEKAINHLEAELVKVRAGKATPGIVDGIGSRLLWQSDSDQPGG